MQIPMLVGWGIPPPPLLPRPGQSHTGLSDSALMNIQLFHFIPQAQNPLPPHHNGRVGVAGECAACLFTISEHDTKKLLLHNTMLYKCAQK